MLQPPVLPLSRLPASETSAAPRTLLPQLLSLPTQLLMVQTSFYAHLSQVPQRTKHKLSFGTEEEAGQQTLNQG